MTDQGEWNEKYDRQIRLWGLGGQANLKKSHICLINATGAGTETMKNLVLPGIGAFTVLDSATVTEDDLGNNFFVTVDSLGKSRAQETTQLLSELNPDVKGSFVCEDIEKIIENEPKYFSKGGYTLVIATQLRESVLVKLAKMLADDLIPLVACRSYGLMGFVRLQSPPLAVIETFPDQRVENLRLRNPPDALVKYVEEIGDPDKITDGMEHGHIPYFALLIHYFNKWKKETNWSGEGDIPIAERRKIVAMMKAGRQKDDDGNVKDEENFKEGCNNAHKLNPPGIPDEINNLIHSAEADDLTENSDPFWFCVNSLKQFYQRHLHLPFSGKLDDMTATTKWYVALQRIYNDIAETEAKEITEGVRQALDKLTAQGKKPPTITDDYIDLFCKNATSLRYVKWRTVAEEVDAKTAKTEAIAADIKKEESSLVWYLLMRAGDKMFEEQRRFPGDQTDNIEADTGDLEKILRNLLSELSISQSIDTGYIFEWVRFGASELHNVDAVLGGIASQEAIKLITKQRCPISNTLFFNGISGTISTSNL
eukprot:TRINITY_DN68273_c0_g1_i1.p1 TRINITY_DN68273_c0_g1~~TRINITY_DN68273_c0_g1_i1.p1  ORF type:complete len:539 (-),score=96.92 TRINITY_DN68273_c0_g1_i1:118-1734(-)